MTNIILTFQEEVQLVKNVPVAWNQSGSGIDLKQILKHIQSLGKQLDGLQISYYSEKDEMDVFMGVYPLKDDAIIPSSEFTQDKL